MTVTELDLRLDAVRERGEFPADVLDELKTFIREAPEEALFRMSPVRYARTRGMPESRAIDLFLYATHAGVLEFAWGVLCPGCFAFLTTYGGLRMLHEKKRCNFCRIDIDGQIDDRVEVAFTVSQRGV